MDDLDVRIKRLALEGRCCTQIMVQIALEDTGRENRQMADAVGALCLGLYAGDCCGALSGGALSMALLADRPLDTSLVSELVEWFRERHGATDCETLLNGDPMARFTRCPGIVQDTYEEAVEVLICHGFYERRFPAPPGSETT